jgi:hypothetical protein
MMAEREVERAERAARLADQQRMAEMFQYMQSLGAAQGFAPPPPLFPTIDPALVGSMLRRRRSYRKRWYSAEAVSIR